MFIQCFAGRPQDGVQDLDGSPELIPRGRTTVTIWLICCCNNQIFGET